MKSSIKRVLPPRLVSFGQESRAKLRRYRERREVSREFQRDAKRYARFMLVSDGLVHREITGANLEAQLTKDYHRIEKGLALPNPRHPFGAVVRARIALLAGSADGTPYVTHVDTARTALDEWNDTGVISEEIAPTAPSSAAPFEGVQSFFESRHSVRSFQNLPVAQALIDEAVTLAINTPSVCNRQSWRVRFYFDGDVERVLQHQNGNAGFGHTVPVVALVTVDQRFFAGPTERNQGFIDGGLFAMSLVWALHGLGLGTCMLNLSLSSTAMTALRSEAGFGEDETAIMMIAIGHGQPGYRRARSPRRHLSEVRLDRL